MGIFKRAKNDKPAWLETAREFCRANNINIMAWGPNALVVEAKTPERASETAALLANLGFQPMTSEEDAYAGMLTLSHPDR